MILSFADRATEVFFEVLREEHLKPLGLSARALAEAIGVPANRLSEIVRERRGITTDYSRIPTRGA